MSPVARPPAVLPAPPVLLIADRRLARAPVADVVAASFEAGCRWLMIREKDLDTDALAAFAAPLVDRARRHGATAIVNGDVEAARRCGADGVHLPQALAADAARIAAARALRGGHGIVGISAHDAAEAAAAAGADYVTLSPVFPSLAKPGHAPAEPLAGLPDIADGLALPVIALGGVTAANARHCLSAGAAGIAVLGAVMQADDPRAAMAALVAAVDG